jgi:xanthine dehydrogenase/oxidase
MHATCIKDMNIECFMSCRAPWAGSMQVSGEAQYTDDVQLPPNTLHAAFITSKKPHAKLLGVDASAALAMPGALLTTHKSKHLGSVTGRTDLSGVAHTTRWCFVASES